MRMNGNTCIHDAIDAGSFDVMKFLVEHNGDINISGHHFKTPLDLAEMRKWKFDQDSMNISATQIPSITNPWGLWIKVKLKIYQK